MKKHSSGLVPMPKKPGEDDEISEALSALGWEEEKEPSEEAEGSSEVTRLRERVTELQQVLVTANGKIVTLDSQLHQATEDLTAQLNTNADMESKIEQLTNQLLNAQSKQAPDDLEEQLSAKDQRLMQLEDTVNELQTTLQDFQEQLNNKSEELAKIQKENSELEEQVGNLGDTDQISQLEKTVQQKDEIISLKNDEISDLEGTIENLRNDLLQVQADVQSKVEALATIEASVGEQKIQFQEQAEELKRYANEKDDNLAQKEEQIVNLTSELETAREDASKITQKLED
ncbi:MAG TPA: hypothetical protein VKK79_15460, partial [Candidatus Lokiarchaeia archaeon]|nr:hypothetical protein [Candidatus Lokiarchaeia archaeon]